MILKARLEKDGVFIMGRGRYMLLKAVERSGSIATAAREMGMSYRHAWGMIRAIEEAAGGRVVESSRGGRGGYSKLTPMGRTLLQKYETMLERARNALGRSYRLE